MKQTLALALIPAVCIAAAFVIAAVMGGSGRGGTDDRQKRKRD